MEEFATEAAPLLAGRADPLATAASLLQRVLPSEAGGRAGTSLLFRVPRGVTEQWFRAAEAVIQMELEQITAEHIVTERSSSEKKSILINVPLDKLVASVVDYQVRNTVLFPR